MKRIRVTKEEYAEAEETFEAFVKAGVQAKKIRDYFWMINGIGVFPTTKKYILNGETKSYEKLSDLAKIDKIFIEP